MESLTWVLSFCSDLDLELMHGLNEELYRHSLETVVKLVFL